MHHGCSTKGEVEVATESRRLEHTTRHFVTGQAGDGSRTGPRIVGHADACCVTLAHAVNEESREDGVAAGQGREGRREAEREMHGLDGNGRRLETSIESRLFDNSLEGSSSKSVW